MPPWEEESSKKVKLERQGMSRPLPYPFALKVVNKQLIPVMADMVQSYDKSGWLPATVWFRTILSGPDPPISRVLQCNVLHSLIRFLMEDNFQLQREAAKALMHIASGTWEAAKALMHIASGTCDEVDPMSAAMMIDSYPMFSAGYTIMWLLNTRNDEVLLHAYCSLAVLSGCENVRIKELIEPDVYYKLYALIISCDKLVAAALRLLGNLVKGDEDLIDHMIRCTKGVLPHALLSCLYHEHMNVRKEACWMISYITAGSEHCKQEAIQAGLITPLVTLIKHDNLLVMIPAVHAISNAASGATPEQIRYLVHCGCIDVLCHLVCCRNSAIFTIVLKGLEAILAAGEIVKSTSGVNPYAEHIGEIKGWKVLAKMANHYRKKLFIRVNDMLCKYGNYMSYAFDYDDFELPGDDD